MTSETIDLTTFFTEPDIDLAALERYADAAHVSASAREQFESLVRDAGQRVESGGADPLRHGLGLLILGHYADALAALGRAPAGRLRYYAAAQAALYLGRHDEALTHLKGAASAGWDGFEIDMLQVVVHAQAGNADAAEKLVSKHAQTGPDRGEWHHARGLLAEMRFQREEAVAAYDKALTLNPTAVPTMFRAARLCDLCGDDERALALYEALTRQPRAAVNALMNAAVVYEDVGDYDRALRCLWRVLRAYPNHARARLFLKDVESCREMVIHEGGEERVDARMRLMSTPLSEFELSVRARNCLKKMNIRTIGELIRLTEAELLAYKNFGETSLNEIKALLQKKGLRLGVQPEEVEVAAAEEEVVVKPTLPPGQEAILGKPVAELELSVRSRRCLQRLNVQTLADLLQYSESDLLATRNFGVTSLNEVKSRLTEFGLQLAPKRTK